MLVKFLSRGEFKLRESINQTSLRLLVGRDSKLKCVGLLGYFFVELLGRFVLFVGVPIDSRDPSMAGDVNDCLNQSRSGSASS